jgi:hypothetical protein
MPLLNSLGALNEQAFQPDTESLIKGYLDRKDRLDELKRNLALQGVVKNAAGQVTSGFASGATPADVSSLEGDINEDPSMGLAAQKRTADLQNQVASDVRYTSPEATQQRGDVLAEKLGIARAPAEAQGAGALAVEKEKNRGALAMQQDELANTLKLMGRGPASDNGGAQGAQAASPEFTTDIGANGKASLHQVKTPQQVQAQQHAAQAGLAQYEDIEKGVLDAAKRGLTGPIAGPLRNAETSSGFSSWDPTLSNQDEASARNLAVNLSLLKSNLAYAHGAARGGASPGMQQRFDPLFNVNMSPSALAGSMAAARKWLAGYAQATNGFTKIADPSHLALLDQSLGINASGDPLDTVLNPTR